MDYRQTTWVNDETPVNAENLNNIEDGISELAQESHTHSNKLALDALTQTKINQIEHSNRIALDAVTAEKLNQIHIHNNKTLIDGITQTMMETLSKFKINQDGETETDINKITTCGLYGVINGILNAPDGESGNSAALLVLPAYDGIIQIFIPYGVEGVPNDRMYIRTLYGHENNYGIDCNWVKVGNNIMAQTSMLTLNESSGIVECSQVNAWGADNAKYFEWADGNPDGEERIGLFVTLEGEKIKVASSAEEYILGVVSGMASFVGNAYESWWSKRYIKDIYGRPVLENITVPASYNKGGKMIRESYEKQQFVKNPAYDPEQEYIPRSQRPEWDIVGISGIMVLRDDGSCQCNGYCKPTDGGIATIAEEQTQYRVLKRLDARHIKIHIK